MKQCWPEGDLRAYLDGELAPEAMAQLASHLKECSECEGRRMELAARAGLVGALMEDLEAPPVVAAAPVKIIPRRAVRWQWWAGAAAALAAGFWIGTVTLHKEQPRSIAVAPIVRAPQSVEREPVVVPEAQSSDEAERPRLAITRPKRAPSLKQEPNVERFIALDDEPIESGMIVRVALGVERVPADVIYSPDGRARAIRLVDMKAR